MFDEIMYRGFLCPQVFFNYKKLCYILKNVMLKFQISTSYKLRKLLDLKSLDYNLSVSYLYLIYGSSFVVQSCRGGELDFPPGFRFGAASSAYQVEGAWNVSDKSPSIWDSYSHLKPSRINDGTNGDVACDSYHLWRKDIQIAKQLGLHYYRFSLSWPRLLPTGFSDKISEDGKNYYNNLIDGLLDEGIEPMVTIFHWDLPQRLQDLGGWSNPLLADWFADYARVAYTLFSPRVKIWLTINEPSMHCAMGYGSDVFPPALNDSQFAYYLCNKHMLMAHAKAWRVYDEEFRGRFGGKVSLALHSSWYEPVSKEDEEIINLANQYIIGRYSHPIFSKEGGWPPVVADHIAELSKKEGYRWSRLPEFTQEEIELVKGTYDFYAHNHYTSVQVRRRGAGEEVGKYPFDGILDVPVQFSTHEDWAATSVPFFKVYPEGIRNSLVWLKRNYGDLEFMITENGLATDDDTLYDYDRRKYYKDYMGQVLLAIKEDGVNVTAYTAWTLLDNFEWSLGFQQKFGLYAVDFTSPLRTRTPRLSARWYADVIRRHSLDVIERDEL